MKRAMFRAFNTQKDDYWRLLPKIRDRLYGKNLKLLSYEKYK